MSQATIERDWPGPKDDREGVLIRGEFNQDFIDRVKAEVPRGERYWSPEDEAWWVAEDWAELAEDIAVECYGGARIIADEGDRYRSALGENCAQDRMF